MADHSDHQHELGEGELVAGKTFFITMFGAVLFCGAAMVITLATVLG